MSQGDSTRRILLADADAFYVAVARLIDPDGAGKARLLVVGGSAKGRGVVTSASYETRAYGVRSGMPMAQAIRLCPDALRVGVPGGACREKNRAIRGVLEQFTPVVESASIDEFYLDLTGTAQLYRGESLAQIGRRIRGSVHAETGVTVSIGGGTSKLIAKLAAKQAKPHRLGTGVVIVEPGEETDFMASLALADIPGVGPRLQQQLSAHGLRTVGQALAMSQSDLAQLMGSRTGRWLYRRIRGIDGNPVVPRARAKSQSHEATFPRDLHVDADLERELLSLVTRLAAEMRSKNRRARTITVKLRDADFKTRLASRTLSRPADADQVIYEVARNLMHRLRKARRGGVRLLGVAASNFGSTAGSSDQLGLFTDSEHEGAAALRSRRLLQAVDDINTRFGREGIVPGAVVRRHR